MTKIAKQAFRFLDLPPELRNRIYEHVVVLDQPQIPSICSRMHVDKATAAQPAITRPCRATRQKSLPLSHSLNDFDFHVHRCDFSYFFNWVHNVPVATRKHVRIVWLILKDRWTCGRGLLELARWAATSEGTENMDVCYDDRDWYSDFGLLFHDNLMGIDGVMDKTVEAFRGAMALRVK